MESSSHVAPSVGEVHHTVLEDTPASDEVFVVGPDEESAAALVEVLADLDEPPTVRLLARESVLKWLRRDFHLASTAADLTSDETLSLRATDDEFESGLVGEESAISLIRTDDRAAGLGTDDPEFVAAMREQCADAWETADSFNLRTPARSRVYESLAAEFGSEVEADFRAMLDAVETTRSGGYASSEDDDALDEVALTLLAAAAHEIQLYEISTWGEDVGLASKATFSRAKNRLEDEGVIATEKVPVDVGRPRQRLQLGDDRLRDVDPADLPDTAGEMLASAPA